MLYLDYAATSKPSDETLEVMNEITKTIYANPSSLHALGIQARKRYNEAKKELAGMLNTTWKQLVFTATGTEAINMVIKGTFFKHPQKTILTSSIEHHATINAINFVKQQGGHVVEIPVDENGFFDINALENALNTYDVSLLSLIYANNEIGTIQDITPIRSLLSKHHVKLHLDMVQAPAHQAIDFETLSVDFASFSAHKFYGPRGVGFLYIKDKADITPLIHGGKQELSLRAGTENLSGVVGMVHAFKESQDNLSKKEATILQTAQTFLNALDQHNVDYRLNGPPLGTNRLNSVLNIAFKNQDNQMLSFALSEKEIYVSTGSACHSDVIEASHVIRNISTPLEYQDGCIRFSFSHEESKDEMKDLAKTLAILIQSNDYNK